MGKKTAGTAALKSAPKKGKKFVEEKDAALEIAASVAGGQENKVHARMTRIHQAKESHAQQDAEKKQRSSLSKQKLKETKANILAKRAQLKREKAKMRKESKGTSNTLRKPPKQTPDQPVRKRVSFA